MKRPAATVAERVLAEAFGGPVRLGPEEPLKAGVEPKPNVRRCRVESGPPACPTSVVLKRIIGDDPYDPADVRPTGGSYGLPTMAWRLLADWTTTCFLGELAAENPPAPRCWGGDFAEGVLVLEDLGPVETLRDLLHASNRQRAEQGMLAYATTLGRLHALTASREAEYVRLWVKLGGGATPGALRDQEVSGLRKDLRSFRLLGDHVGLSGPPGLEGELAGLVTWMADPGPFLALGHVDNQPINTHFDGNGVRLFDFEYSRYFPCMLDGMFLHLYPWTRHRLPNDLTHRMETIYRTELSRGCPEAEDAAMFAQQHTAARAVWMVRTVFHHLSEGALETDVPAEDQGVWVEGEESAAPASTCRQRILRLLKNFAAEAEARGCLPTLGEMAEQMALRLRVRWHADPYTPPLYPAFH